MRKDIAIAVAAVVVILAVTFGLAKMRPDLAPKFSKPFTAAKDAVTSKEKEGKVVIRVNGEPITEAEFNAFMAAVPEQQRVMFAGPQGRRELANELVRMKTLEQEARKIGVMDDKELQTQLDLLRTQMIAQRTLQKIVEQRAEKEIRAEYEKEKQGKLTLRHIVIGYQGGMVPPKGQGQALSAAAAMNKASGLVSRLRAGASFEELARTESDDAESGQRGGSLGPLNAGALPPEISAVVSKLKPGQYSDPLKTQFGVHIFNVTEPSLEDLKPMLMNQIQNRVAREEVTRLEKAAKVDLDPQFFPPATVPVTPAVRGAAPAPRPRS